MDYSALVIGGKRPGLGLSLSKAVGDSSVLYTDTTLRQGREKQVISGAAHSGQLQIEPRKTTGLYPFVTLGVGYTFDNNISINLELAHDAGGYSDQEWSQVTGALNTISPPQSAVEGSSIDQLNGLLNHFTLRQNYAFVRVSTDNILASSINGEITNIYGIDDGSGSFGLRLGTSLGDRITAGLYTTHRFGVKNHEFTLRPETGFISLYMKTVF